MSHVHSVQVDLKEGRDAKKDVSVVERFGLNTKVLYTATRVDGGVSRRRWSSSSNLESSEDKLRDCKEIFKVAKDNFGPRNTCVRESLPFGIR